VLVPPEAYQACGLHAAGTRADHACCTRTAAPWVASHDGGGGAPLGDMAMAAGHPPALPPHLPTGPGLLAALRTAGLGMAERYQRHRDIPCARLSHVCA